MIYILAGITCMCGLICLCGLLEKLWDMLTPTTEAAHRSQGIARNRQHKKAALVLEHRSGRVEQI